MQIFGGIVSARRASGERAFRALFTAVSLLLAVSADGATFTVNNTGDGADGNLGDNLCQTASAVCTLRAAIQQANATAGMDLIAFSIAGSPPHVIAPVSALPDVIQPVIIDGATAPTYGGMPVIVVDGASAGAGVSGLTLAAGSDGSTLRAVVVQRFAGHGVVIHSDGNSLVRNFVATDATGSSAGGNGGHGLLVFGRNNVLGGTTYAERNVVSANATGGLFIGGGTGNLVQASFIGTNYAGNAALANGGSGVFLHLTSANTLRANVISGNTVDGVRIVGGGSNTVESHNLIGVNADGTAAVANRNHGVYVEDSASNTIGPAAIISGNAAGGIYIAGPASTGNLVHGNFIGTRLSGVQALGNGGPGIAVVGAGPNRIGAPAPGTGNVISGNAGAGVYVSAGGGNQVLNNTIGGDPNGGFAIANGGHGVHIQDSPNNTVGIDAFNAGANFISGNGGSGAFVSGPASTGTLIAGNTIGASRDGLAAIPNAGHGIALSGVSNATIGGDVSGEDNVIAGNGQNGIYVAGGANNLIFVNHIGIDGAGTVPVPNGGAGILIENALSTTVRNSLVSGNGADGIRLVGGSGALLVANLVGTNITATTAVANRGAGISIENSANNTVGRSVAGEGNVVSGNAGSGVQIVGALSTDNVVRNTVIGLDLSASQPVANQGHGVYVDGGTRSTIGGSAGVDANRIGGNLGAGVAILSGTSNAIRMNLIHSNGRLGIDLDRDGVLPVDGVTFNDPGDAEGGANALQNSPVFTAATTESVSGVLRGAANTTYAVDVFGSAACDASGFGEGVSLLNTASVATNAAGYGTFIVGFGPVGAGTMFAATATGPSGNSSEFSQCIAAGRVPVETLTLFNPTQNFVSLLASSRDLPPLDAYTSYVAVPPASGQWVVGDWNGDGIETAAVYTDGGAFFYTNDMGQTRNWTGIWFGLGGRPPVAGRFDAAVEHDCLGVVDSAPWPGYGTAFALYFTCDLTGGEDPPKRVQWIGPVLPDTGFSGVHQFGAGDFDGDGVASMAVRRGPYIAWTNVPPTTIGGEFALAQYIGAPGAGDGQLVVGDWDGDGIASFGLLYPDHSFYRRDDLAWNSGAYTLQRVGEPIGNPVTASSWRSGGSAGRPD